jgi:hypothetical protein
MIVSGLPIRVQLAGGPQAPVSAPTRYDTGGGVYVLAGSNNRFLDDITTRCIGQRYDIATAASTAPGADSRYDTGSSVYALAIAPGLSRGDWTLWQLGLYVFEGTGIGKGYATALGSEVAEASARGQGIGLGQVGSIIVRALARGIGVGSGLAFALRAYGTGVGSGQASATQPPVTISARGDGRGYGWALPRFEAVDLEEVTPPEPLPAPHEFSRSGNVAY